MRAFLVLILLLVVSFMTTTWGLSHDINWGMIVALNMIAGGILGFLLA